MPTIQTDLIHQHLVWALVLGRLLCATYRDVHTIQVCDTQTVKIWIGKDDGRGLDLCAEDMIKKLADDTEIGQLFQNGDGSHCKRIAKLGKKMTM